MTFTPDEGSHVESVDADPQTGQVRIKFKTSPRVYTHQLPPDKVPGIMTAWEKFPSTGGYYQRYVRSFPLVLEEKAG